MGRRWGPLRCQESAETPGGQHLEGVFTHMFIVGDSSSHQVALVLDSHGPLLPLEVSPSSLDPSCGDHGKARLPPAHPSPRQAVCLSMPCPPGEPL